MTFLAFCAFLALSVPAVGASLLQAIAQVESGGNPRAVGPLGHLGLLQVGQGVVSDVNRVTGSRYRHRDALDPAKAEAMFRAYLAIYATERRLGRPVTDEDRARIWNGGPNGWRREATKAYWRRVRTELNRGA